MGDLHDGQIYAFDQVATVIWSWSSNLANYACEVGPNRHVSATITILSMYIVVQKRQKNHSICNTCGVVLINVVQNDWFPCVPIDDIDDNQL